MQAATAAIISWDAMRLPTPSCLYRGEVESPRGRECASSLTQLSRGVCVLERKEKAGRIVFILCTWS